jgi:parvulin-like peptidyl-prolyl isomerase
MGGPRSFMVCALAAWIAGCGGGSRSSSKSDPSRGSSSVGGTVVSTVDGHPITVQDVLDLTRASALSPSQALLRLQEERLLMLEAERRGVQHASEVSLTARQARAQALLDAVASTAAVRPEEIEAAYRAEIGRFAQPERRASVHVLASVPEDASPELDARARTFIEQTIAKLVDAQDLDAFMTRVNAAQPEGFGVVAQRVPETDRAGNLVAPYLAALFAAAEPGVHRAPVRSRFGWHAIRVTEIKPAVNQSLAEAAAVLREELLVERRAKLANDLIERLRKEHGVEVADTALEVLAAFDM